MRPTLRSTMTALGAASFLALLEIFRTTLTGMLEGRSSTVFDLLHRVIPMWITIVITSPWCAVMARRFPFRGGRLLRTLAAHFGGAAVFVALHLTMIITYHSLMSGTRPFSDGGRLLHAYAFYIALEMSVYAGIVVVVLLLDTRRESSERALAAARLEQNLAAARLESLQAQIQPHFLFNTLNALAVLARRGDGAAVDHAIGDLGELLRASFDASGRHEIALGEELEFLERYVSLQRIRFPDRLQVHWQIAEESKYALVPPLVVQPLVENAIEHGLATARGGNIRVSAHRDGDTLELEVADDGPGFGGDAGVRNGGVGLANTRERLALLYGKRGSLACDDGPGGGGVVRIRLPWHVGHAAETPA